MDANDANLVNKMEFKTKMAKQRPICLKNLIPFVFIRINSRLKFRMT